MSTHETSDREQDLVPTPHVYETSAGVRREFHAKSSEQTRAATTAIIEAARLKLGMQVLDLASGSGNPALSIAAVVRQDGHVTATDLSADVLQVAGEEAVSQGLNNISFQAAGAESLPFPDQSFDLVTCQMGLMIFQDVGRALREIYRVLKPGGRFAAVVQGLEDRNDWQSCFLKIFRKYVPVPTPGPGAPHPFKFAEQGSLSRVLTAAALNKVREDFLEVPWPWPGTPEDCWERRQSEGALYPRLIERVPPEQRPELFEEVLESMGKYDDGHKVNFTACIVVGSGLRPL